MCSYFEKEKEFEDMVLTPKEIRRFNNKYRAKYGDDYTVPKYGIVKSKVSLKKKYKKK